jgi:hypothetical protein
VDGQWMQNTLQSKRQALELHRRLQSWLFCRLDEVPRRSYAPFWADPQQRRRSVRSLASMEPRTSSWLAIAAGAHNIKKKAGQYSLMNSRCRVVENRGRDEYFDDRSG